MSGTGDGDDVVAESPDVHFQPVVTLPEVEVKTMEEGEEEIFKMRSKLFRYASECEPAEWKERGTGDVRLLKNEGKGSVRLLMRRDKTHKVCANHYVTDEMKLKPNCGSDRAWVWNTLADYTDQEAKGETLAIRFANAANAQKFKEAFEQAQDFVRTHVSAAEADDADADAAEDVAKKLDDLSVKDGEKKDEAEAAAEEKKESTKEEAKAAEPEKKEEAKEEGDKKEESS